MTVHDNEIACFGLSLADVKQRGVRTMLPVTPTTPTIKTPHTDWFESHTSALEGSAMTQTYWDCAPSSPTFELAWTLEPSANARIRVAAERYVEINERRPLRMGFEIDYHTDQKLAGGVTLPAGTYCEGFDLNHFELTTLAEIAVRMAGTKTAQRARALIFAHARFYLEQPDSYFALAQPTYGMTGRVRIARMCINALRAVMRVVGNPAHPEYVQAKHLLVAHLTNIFSRGRAMRDETQSDGIKAPHWRCFQLAMLFHELIEVKRVTGIDTQPWIDGLMDVMDHAVVRLPNGTVVGFNYDVPEPWYPNQPPNVWPTDKEIGKGNGVELWMFSFLPDDARAFIKKANANLHPAVATKFGMPAIP